MLALGFMFSHIMYTMIIIEDRSYCVVLHVLFEDTNQAHIFNRTHILECSRGSNGRSLKLLLLHRFKSEFSFVK